MELFQFKLELSGNSGIPSQYRIDIGDVCHWMKQQVEKSHHRDIQITPHFHRGAFTLQTTRKETADILRSLTLEFQRNGRTHRVDLKTVHPDKPRTWVRFWGTRTGAMALLPNSFFDSILEEGGFTILQPTENRTHRNSDFVNGQRSALVMRGDNHLEREREWVDEDGNCFKWRLEYDGQPHRCTRGCNTYHHDGKCDSWAKRKEKKNFDGQQPCYMISSSLLRLATDTKTTKIDAIPGAKIGHLANHVNNDGKLFQHANIVAIHAGSNMDLGTVEESKPHIEAQAAELVQVVKPLVEAEKKVYIVDPVVGPLIKEDRGGDHWALVRATMKRTASKCKASWVSLEHVDWDTETDVLDDGVHYTKSGTQKLLNKVAERIRGDTGVDILEGMELQEKPYAGIYRQHYKVGCYKCTRLHERGPCPPLSSPGDGGSSSSSSDGDSSSSATGDNNNDSSSNPHANESILSRDLEDAASAAAAAAAAAHSISDDDSSFVEGANLQMSFVEMVIDDPGRRASLGGPETVRVAAESRTRSASVNKRAREPSDDSMTQTGNKKKKEKTPSKDKSPQSASKKPKAGKRK